MKLFLWLSSLLLLAVAAGATYLAFSNPHFVATLATIAASAAAGAIASAWRALAASKGSPEARQAIREGRELNERESR